VAGKPTRKIAWPEDPEVFRAELRELGTSGVAEKYGTTSRYVRKRKAKLGMSDEGSGGSTPGPDRSGIRIEGDTATITTRPLESLGAIDERIREYGLDPAEWFVVSSDINQYEMLADGGGGEREPTVVTLKQFKFKLKRIVTLAILSPATHVPELVKPKKVKAAVREPDLIVVEGDHQIPYNDPKLDDCVNQLVTDLQPTEHVFLGDTLDYPTISRFPDHPAAMATPQECVNLGYSMLRKRAEASPNTKRTKLEGNHDARPDKELLSRAERLYGIAPAYEDEPALSHRRLLHLDRLGVNLIKDIRGWEHAIYELVPGRDGLEVRHGFIVGQNTAEKTLKKVGRSFICGHVHESETRLKLDYPEKVLRWAHINASMCRNDGVFPHFQVNPDWNQGCSVVVRWPNGKFNIERAVFDDGALYWRDRKYAA
jgi:hypothetical protein